MNVFELFAKLSLDSSEYDKGLHDASEKTSRFGSSIGNGLKTAAKVGVAAVGAAATAIGALAKESVAGFAEQEQLIGGIETMYKNSADTMIAYANDAFKTAGLSANEYMSTAIESSAAMISSLDGDTKKAAEMTNMAITDMSDNVNKMGTSMESLQNAYRGFSRGNFTMLDNLALGFAGTKEGMQQLLDKAKELSGVEYNIDSYADIVQAIHVVQDEFGITGTTAKEASSTISGSLASMKTAWENLVVGFSNENANIGQMIDNLVNSAETAFKNIMPAVERALTGIASFVEKIAPILAEKLPAVIGSVLPSLLNAATNLINGLVSALPSILQVLIDQVPMIISMIVPTIVSLLPQIVELGLQLILALADGISQNLPTLVPVIVKVVLDICDNLVDNIDLLVDATIQLMAGLTEGMIMALPDILARVPDIIIRLCEELLKGGAKLTETAVMMTTEMFAAMLAEIAGWDLFQDIEKKVEDAGNSISEKWNKFTDKISDTSKLKDAAKSIENWMLFEDDTILGSMEQTYEEWGGGLEGAFAAAAFTIDGFIAGVIEAVGKLFNVDLSGEAEAVFDGIRNNFIIPITTAFEELPGKVTGFIRDIWDEITLSFDEGGGGLSGIIEVAFDQVANSVRDVLDMIGEIFDTDMSAIEDKFISIWFGIRNKVVDAVYSIQEGIQNAWETIVEILSPLLDAIKYLIETIFIAIQVIVGRIHDSIVEKIKEAWNSLLEIVSPILESIKNFVNEAWQAICDTVSSAMNKVRETVSEKWNSIVEFISPILDSIKEIINTVWTEITDVISEGLVKADEEINEVWSKIKEFFSETIEDIKTKAIEGFEKILEGVSKPINKIKEVFKEAFDNIKSIVTDLANDALQWGADMMDKLIEGIRSRISNLAGSIREVADTIRRIIGFSEPEEGPLSNFHTYAPDMMELFAKGIKDNAHLINDQLKNSISMDALYNNVPTERTYTPTNSMVTSGGDTRTQTVILQIDRTELGRVVYELNNDETRRIGVKLAGGVI